MYTIPFEEKIYSISIEEYNKMVTPDPTSIFYDPDMIKTMVDKALDKFGGDPYMTVATYKTTLGDYAPITLKEALEKALHITVDNFNAKFHEMYWSLKDYVKESIRTTATEIRVPINNRVANVTAKVNNLNTDLYNNLDLLNDSIINIQNTMTGAILIGIAALAFLYFKRH